MVGVRQRTKRVIIALACAMGLSAVVALPAQAHYVYEKFDVYTEDGGLCVKGRDEISHGKYGNGYLKTWTESWWDQILIWGADCSIGTHLVPAGWIALNPTVYWDARDTPCTNWGWQYNTGGTGNGQWRVEFIRDFKEVPHEGECLGLAGWYGTYAGHYVMDDGIWKGAWLFSGYHWLPTSPAKTDALEGLTDKRVPPALPAWVDPDTMKVDILKVPASMKVNGNFAPPPPLDGGSQ